MIKELLRDYNEFNKPCDKIAECEEDCDDGQSSSRTKSDFDALEYEEAMGYLKRPVQTDKNLAINKDMHMTQLPYEYTEFNGQQLISSTQTEPEMNQSVLKKARRSRKDRARDGAKSGTGTTSSSGINAGGTTISSSVYDYNLGHLTTQYGNGVS